MQLWLKRLALERAAECVRGIKNFPNIVTRLFDRYHDWQKSRLRQSYRTFLLSRLRSNYGLASEAMLK